MVGGEGENSTEKKIGKQTNKCSYEQIKIGNDKYCHVKSPSPQRHKALAQHCFDYRHYLLITDFCVRFRAWKKTWMINTLSDRAQEGNEAQKRAQK